MDIRQLSETVTGLIRRKQFGQAEAMLSAARQETTESGDFDALDFVLSEFAALCGQMEPPDIARVEAFCLEREAVRNTGYNKWQTAMTFYWVVRDSRRTVIKSREAVQKATEEKDSKTLYSALSLLGLALLELDRIEEAGATLNEIGNMARRKMRIVVGDETLFLERANERGLDRPTIKDIANILAPVCRDQSFAERLRALAVQELPR